MKHTPTYANGLPYRRIQSRLHHPQHCNGSLSAQPQLPELTNQTPADWLTFWRQTRAVLAANNYQPGTLIVYRQVLRSLRAFIARHAAINSPRSCTPSLMKEFLWQLTRDECSWSWVSVNISVIRTAFDKLQNHSITSGIRSPKRKHSLSDILSENEVRKMQDCTPLARDKLLIGLLYGCGPKVSEVAALKWRDITPDIVQVQGHRARQLPLPPGYKDLMITAKARCEPEDYIFRGKEAGQHISSRSIERMVKKAAAVAGIHKLVCCMTLRHSYAVACLKSGENLLQLKINLGQQHLETTEQYLRYLPAHNIKPAIHPSKHDNPIDTTELQLPFPCENQKTSLYEFLTNLPHRLLFTKPLNTT